MEHYNEPLTLTLSREDWVHIGWVLGRHKEQHGTQVRESIARLDEAYMGATAQVGE